MLDILPPGGLPPLTSREILERATSVDLVTNEEFISASRKAELPKPRVSAHPRENTYTGLLSRQLPLSYDAPVDGRVVAAKFVDHLGELTDKNYQIGRPARFDPGFLLFEIRRLSGTKVPDKEAKMRLEEYRKRLGDLNDYAMGRVRIVDRDGETRYYFNGALPQTHSVLITVPIGVNGQAHAAIYRSFLEKLGK